MATMFRIGLLYEMCDIYGAILNKRICHIKTDIIILAEYVTHV